MAYIDAQLDSDWDLQLDADKNLQLCAGVDLVTQRLIIGLKLFLGECYWDEGAGMPYWQNILCDQPQSNLIEAVFRQKILEDPEILSVTSFSMTADTRARRVTVQFTAVSAYGEITVSEVFP